MEFLTRNNSSTFYNPMDPSAVPQWGSYPQNHPDRPMHGFPPAEFYGHYSPHSYPYSPKPEEHPRNYPCRESARTYSQDTPPHFNPDEEIKNFPLHPISGLTECTKRLQEDHTSPYDAIRSYKKDIPSDFTPENSEGGDFSPPLLPPFGEIGKRLEDDQRVANFFQHTKYTEEKISLYSQISPKLRTSSPKTDEELVKKDSQGSPQFPTQFPGFPNHSPVEEPQRQVSPILENKGYFDPTDATQNVAGRQENTMIAVGNDGAPIIYPWMAGRGSGADSKKRSRQQYTRLQTCQLEQEFRTTAYLTKLRRQQIADSLGLTERQIKIWFQNRRMKWKKTNKCPPPVNAQNPYFSG